MSVAQMRGQCNHCLKRPAANVTGVGCFSMCRCFLQPVVDQILQKICKSLFLNVAPPYFHSAGDIPSGPVAFPHFVLLMAISSWWLIHVVLDRQLWDVADTIFSIGLWV